MESVGTYVLCPGTTRRPRLVRLSILTTAISSERVTAWLGSS